MADSALPTSVSSTKSRLSRLASSQHGVQSGAIRAACVFVLLYLFLVYTVSGISTRDPGSWFFDASVAYEHRYTTVRQQQAQAHISAASTSALHRSGGTGEVPRMCVGISSIAREGAHYLPDTLGSLLEGLTNHERDGLHVIVLIAHSNPDLHPAYNEPWLTNLADEVLTYNNMSHSEREAIEAMEAEQGLFQRKGLYDYTHLLQACDRTGAPYVAMFEDDVIAVEGWYHRTLESIVRAESRNAVWRDTSDFLYLRLFYTEEFLGWNSEDWPTYAFWCVCVVGFCGFLLAWSRRLTPRMILLICGLPLPLLILLYFAAGKVTVLPLSHGVNAMNDFGCCSQGLLFRRQKIPHLVAWYQEKQTGFVDVLTEEYADRHGGLRWAMTPSVIQHVGQRSSKGDDFGQNAKHHRSVAEKIWNFEFELYDAAKLRTEHEEIWSY